MSKRISDRQVSRSTNILEIPLKSFHTKHLARNEVIYNYYGHGAVIDNPRQAMHRGDSDINHVRTHNSSRYIYGPQLGVLGGMLSLEL